MVTRRILPGHDDEQVEMSTDEARQGSTLHVVRYVLIFGFALSAIALLIGYALGAP